MFSRPVPSRRALSSRSVVEETNVVFVALTVRGEEKKFLRLPNGFPCVWTGQDAVQRRQTLLVGQPTDREETCSEGRRDDVELGT